MAVSANPNNGLRLPQAAAIAGISLLIMAVCAPAAYFYFIPQTLVSGDIDATIQQMEANGTPYIIGLGLLFLTYCMDVVVAWALYWLLRPGGQEALSLLVAWMRLLYTALAFSSLLAKFGVYELATATPGSHVDIPTSVFLSLSQSSSYEAVALLFFGLHLVALSVLIWRAEHVPKWLSAPVLLSGIAYIVMYSLRFAAPSVELEWLLILGIGELVFMAWLLAMGTRLRDF